MQQKNFHIPMEQMLSIESKLGKKKDLDNLVKSFEYDDSKPLEANLKILGDMVCEYFQLSPRVEKALREYLVDKNIPIEVNFKPLKQNQLKSIIQEWVTYNTESSTIIEKIYTNNHRNILFKRVLFQEKETISEYFSTLSDRNMLKAFDIYQLLVDILSRYFLYEYNCDSIPFFDKVNSFNIFIEIVQKFIHSEKRISLGTSKEDFDYIRRIEFERLISFWEEVNPELTLLPEERINMQEVAVQTTLVNMVNQDIQTQREAPTLMNFINNSLNILNHLTLNNQHLQELMIIENLYSALRKQKINLISVDKRNVNSADCKLLNEIDIQSNISPITHNGDLNETVQPFQLLKMIDKQSIEQQFFRTPSPTKPVKDALLKIYDLYRGSSVLSVDTLEKCLLDIGVVSTKQSPLFKSLEVKNIIPKKKILSFEQFQHIFIHLMGQDRELTLEVLEQFYYSRTNRSNLMPPNSRQRASTTYRKEPEPSYTKSRTFIGKYLDSTLKY